MSRKHITEAEFGVLEALWEHGPQTIRELTRRVYASDSVSDYASVQKLLERLEKKSYVRRDRSGHAHVFRPTGTRDELVAAQLQQLAEKLCEGSLAPVLMQLVHRVKLSPKDRAKLRSMLGEDRR